MADDDNDDWLDGAELEGEADQAIPGSSMPLDIEIPDGEGDGDDDLPVA